MHPEILGEIADARLAERRREAAQARRVLAARRAGDARRRPGPVASWWRAVAALAAQRGRGRNGAARRALRPRVRGAR